MKKVLSFSFIAIVFAFLAKIRKAISHKNPEMYE